MGKNLERVLPFFLLVSGVLQCLRVLPFTLLRLMRLGHPRTRYILTSETFPTASRYGRDVTCPCERRGKGLWAASREELDVSKGRPKYPTLYIDS